MPAGRGPAGEEIRTMSKKSTKATKTGKKTAKKTKGEDQLMKKFQTGAKPARTRSRRAGLLPHEMTDLQDAPGLAMFEPEVVEREPKPSPADENAAPTAATIAPTGDAEPAAAKDTTAPAGGDTGEPGATGGKRMGLVSAAIRVLQDTGNEPMSCPDMVKQATERGYWQPRAGKTPASTLYAAILREVRDKGETSRFRKTDRGRFALAS